jgi:hypothetical protein
LVVSRVACCPPSSQHQHPGRPWRFPTNRGVSWDPRVSRRSLPSTWTRGSFSQNQRRLATLHPSADNAFRKRLISLGRRTGKCTGLLRRRRSRRGLEWKRGGVSWCYIRCNSDHGARHRERQGQGGRHGVRGEDAAHLRHSRMKATARQPPSRRRSTQGISLV